MIANGLGGLVDLASGFGLVMKPKPKHEDKKGEGKKSLILKLAHLVEIF